MKKCKRMFALLMALMVCCSICISAGAVEQEDLGSPISRFYYTVYDKDGNVKETGILPSPNERVTWHHITLENGESVNLKRDDGDNFYAVSNTRIRFEMTLNRAANVSIEFIDDGGDIITDFRGNEMTSCSFTLKETAYFYVKITNLSSDQLVMKNATLTF